MLDVSLNLVAVVAMLFGIVMPGLHIEVDGLNSPTAKPIPDGRHKMGTDGAGFKASRDARGRDFSRIFPYRSCYGESVSVVFQREGRGEVPPPKSDLFWSAFSRRSFMMRARLWQEGPPYRIRESSALTLVVSQLVWTWSAG
ncbi:hypothetical protein [Xanthobacter flavus]|uniref:hypothetical protein n=1 Tax=Xanthobacter flavus TaxID=281 RepID=UPI00372993E8